MSQISSFDDVLSKPKIYTIPNYQRDYAWKKGNFDDLWEDLVESIAHQSEVNDDKGHFLGTIVIAPNAQKEGVYDVIDGQQRLTTIFMLLYVLIEKSQSEYKGEDKARYLIMRGDFKLQVSDANRAFFKELLSCADRQILPVSEEFKQKQDTEGKRNLYEVLNAILDKTANLQHKSPEKIDLYCKELLKMQMICFTEQSTGRAIRTFQSVNDRGVPLRLLDKLKALLIYYSNQYCGGENGLDTHINECFGEVFRISSCISNHKYRSSIFATQAKQDEIEANIFRYHIWSNKQLFDKRGNKDTNQGVFDSFKNKLKGMVSDKKELEEFLRAYVDDMLKFFQAVEEILNSIDSNVAMFKCLLVENMNVMLYNTFVRLKIDGKLDDEMIEFFTKTDVALLKFNNAESDSLGLIAHYNKDDLSSLKREVYRVCGFARFALTHRINQFIDNSFDRCKGVFHYIFIEQNCKEMEIGNLRELIVEKKLNQEIEHIIPQSHKEDKGTIEGFGFRDEADLSGLIDSYGNLLSLEKTLNGKAKDKLPSAKKEFYSESLLQYNRNFEPQNVNKDSIIARNKEVERWLREEFFKDFL